MTKVSLAGRVAIVTGGGRGLGEAYCHALARLGAAVVVHDSGTSVGGSGADPAVAQAAADAIVANGGTAVACSADASTPSGGRASVDIAMREFGRLDVVVANAGIAHSAPLQEWTAERFDALYRNHAGAAFHVVRPAFEVMCEAGYGRLVFVSSAAGVFGQHGMTGYAAAKTAMLGLMNVAALEGADHGVLANAILPMGDTRMAAAVTGDAATSPEARAFMETLRVDQVAPVVAYLASEQCVSTRTILSAYRGRVAAVQIATTTGWFSDVAFDADDVATNFERITDTESMHVPGSIYDDMAILP